jgi:hypothetical protein
VGSSVILPPPGQPVQGPDPSFHTATTPNIVSFGLERIGPPSPLYVQRDDVLLVGFNTLLAGGDTLTILGRLLLAAPDVSGQPDIPPPSAIPPPGGKITQTIKAINTSLTRASAGVVTQRVPLAEGYLLSLSGQSTNGVTRGQTIAFAWLVRGVGPIGPTSQVLFQDYSSNGNIPSWPGGRNLGPLEGPGWISSVQQANPAAGADWIMTVPAGERRRLITMNADLAVANSGAARPVEIIVDDGANVVARMSTNTAAPINATAHINFSNSGTPSVSITSDLYSQQPSAIYLEPGMRVRSITTNIVAGDQWSNIWFLFERWVDG